MLLLRTAIYPPYILIRAHHTHQPHLLLPRISASWCTYKCPPTICHSQYTPISAFRDSHTGAEAKVTNKRKPRAEMKAYRHSELASEGPRTASTCAVSGHE